MSRGNQVSTTTNAVDPWTQARTQQLWEQGMDANVPYEAYPGGSRVAPMQPLQEQAHQFLAGAFGPDGTGTGIAQAQQAAGVAGQIAGGGQTPMVNPQQVQAGNLMQGIGMYQDPYEDQVVNTALSDIDRSRQMAVQGVNSASTMAGAFGGDRSALVEAETNRAYGDQAARTAAQLRSQGFGQAAQLAQSDAARAMQAGGMNQAAGLSADMANQGAYFTGRNQQLQGAGLLNQFGGDIAGRTLGAGQVLSGVGADQQGQAQAEMSDDVSRWLEERGYNWEQIQRMQALLGGMPYGQTQTTTQPGGSRAAGALGGAASGAGAGFMVGGPLGAGIGAGVGGLMGLF
jgi:hypothetical protein